MFFRLVMEAHVRGLDWREPSGDMRLECRGIALGKGCRVWGGGKFHEEAEAGGP